MSKKVDLYGFTTAEKLIAFEKAINELYAALGEFGFYVSKEVFVNETTLYTAQELTQEINNEEFIGRPILFINSGILSYVNTYNADTGQYTVLGEFSIRGIDGSDGLTPAFYTVPFTTASTATQFGASFNKEFVFGNAPQNAYIFCMIKTSTDAFIGYTKIESVTEQAINVVVNTAQMLSVKGEKGDSGSGGDYDQAITELNERVTDAENSIQTQGIEITSLDNRVEALEDGGLGLKKYLHTITFHCEAGDFTKKIITFDEQPYTGYAYSNTIPISIFPIVDWNRNVSTNNYEEYIIVGGGYRGVPSIVGTCIVYSSITSYGQVAALSTTGLWGSTETEPLTDIVTEI